MLMPSNEESAKDLVASRKLAAAELRKARKAARDPRNRLFSDSSDEVPKGILKNASIPTKRSVSECVDDLSQIMGILNINIHEATTKFCPHHQFFDEAEEDCEDDEDDDSENRNLNDCDCNNRYNDSDNSDKPKKSVRFDERVYETVFFASKLYDRRHLAKYHFSTRHHPVNNNQNKSKKSRQHSSKSESNKDDHNIGTTSLKSDNSHACKQSKSQRAKQSKKDRKKRLNRKDENTDTSSDDQGYCSSMHSFSD